MSLTLSAADFARLEAASRTLLSPLAAPTVDAWRHEAMRAMRELFGADSSMFGLPHAAAAGGAFYASDAVDPAGLRGTAAYIADRATLKGASPDPLVDTFYKRREELGLEAFNLDLMKEVVGHRHTKSEFYNDVWSRYGLHRVHVLYVTTPVGVASLHVHHARGETAFGEGSLGLLRTLVPAFKAGLDAVGRLGAGRAALDALAEPLAVFGAGGQEVHRNAALTRLLGAEPERDRLGAELRRLAAALRPLAFPLRGAAGSAAFAPVRRDVRTARGAYALRGSLLPPGAFGPGDAFMVTVTFAGPPALPAPDALRARFGLTKREAEVALLLAEGLPNEALAERLFVSPHTARHHTENALSKLGLNSRAAVAARLLEVG